jgi:hypothetical protein
VVSVTDPYGCNLEFLDLEPLLFLSRISSIVLTRLSGPVQDPILLRKSGSAGNPIRTSESVARNSDQ